MIDVSTLSEMFEIIHTLSNLGVLAACWLMVV